MGSDLGKGRQPHRAALLAFAGAAAAGYLLFAVAFGGSSEDQPVTAAAGASSEQQRLERQVAAAAGGKDMSGVQAVLEARVCGSPAVDGYAHVDPACLEGSPANKWWLENKPKPEDLDIFIEREADYDGLAVGWGIGNTKKNVEECAEACRQHVPKGDGPFGKLPCNAFAFCAFDVCYEPDAHKHHKGDCWLKFTEGPAAPEVNMRGALSKAMRHRHPDAPERVQWHAGVLLPHGVILKNGSWSPRHDW